MQKKNKINRFIDIIRENYEVDEEYISELTQILKEESIEFGISNGYFSKESFKKGINGPNRESILFKNPTHESDKFCYRISIQILGQTKMEIFKDNVPLIYDIKIFKIFNCLYQICEKVDTFYLSITGLDRPFSTNKNIIAYIINENDIEENSNMSIERTYNEIKNRFLSAKSDYANNTLVKLKDNIITITTSGDYTDRKFDMMMKGIDLSDLTVKKDVNKSDRVMYYASKKINFDSAIITISKK